MLSNWHAATTKQIPTILCYYTNSSPQIQIIQVSEGKKANWKKIIFPRQQIVFNATPEAELEIYTGHQGNAKCIDVISCQSLQVNRVHQTKTSVEAIVSPEQKSA